MITVLGSINLDIVIPVRHLPRPGETALGDSYLMLPGGKGANQALAARRAGAAVAIVGRVGADDFGAQALHPLAAAGVDVSGVLRGAQPTGCATVCVDAQGENLIAVASGANWHVSAEQLQPKHLHADTTILLQMEIPPEQNWRAVSRAHDAGARVVLNNAPAAGIPTQILQQIDVLIANEPEWATIGQTVGLNGSADAIAQSAAARFGLTAIATMGSAGAFLFADQRKLFAAPLSVIVRDTVGAGDAFVGAFTAAFQQRLDMDECLTQGTVAGGLACEATGAQASLPDRDAIAARRPEVSVETVS